MKAIIFDFFGTLTDPAAESDREAAISATGEALGVPGQMFWTAMSASFPERITGALGDTRETLLTIARRCGHEPTDHQLTAAVVVQRLGAATVQRPRPGVFELLHTLRDNGFRFGLISDCSSELVEAWPQSPYAPWFDTAVFSWQEGVRKPDPRLYAAATERLGVSSSDCWYVGDGGGREHQGAQSAGMRPVLVTNSSTPDAARHRADPDEFIPLDVIDDLSDLAYLCSMTSTAQVPATRPS